MTALYEPKIPPHDKEIEMALISAMMQDPSRAVNEISSNLGSQHFYLEKHKKIYIAIVFLFEQAGGAIDIVGLSEVLKKRNEFEFIGGSAYLAELFSLPTLTINLDYYTEQVKGYYFLRKVLATCGSIIERGYKTKENIQEFISEAEQTFLEISSEQNKGGLLTLEEVLKSSLTKLETLYKEKRDITGIPSGIIDFDKITGGFQPSDLVILAARPAMGKTCLALNIDTFASVKKDKTVAVFSLEMAKDQLVMRILAAEARINSSNLRKGFLTSADWTKLTNITERIFKCPIFIDDSTDINITEIRSKCRQLKADKGRLDLVVIDYLQLIVPTRKSGFENREREISEISRGLKALAKEINCPVIALSQLNRLLENRPDKRPKPSDLRESGAIEQDADLIFFIYRDEVYHPNTEDVGKAELIIGKNRHGAIDTVKTAFLKDYTLFQNLYEGG